MSSIACSVYAPASTPALMPRFTRVLHKSQHHIYAAKPYFLVALPAVTGHINESQEVIRIPPEFVLVCVNCFW